jgi:hypothetical protein
MCLPISYRVESSPYVAVAVKLKTTVLGKYPLTVASEFVVNEQ